MEDQKKFLEKINKKTEDLKQQANEANASTLNPNIDETSRRIIEEKMGDRKNKPTYERLYELNKERLQKHAQNILTSHSKFKNEEKS